MLFLNSIIINYPFVFLFLSLLVSLLLSYFLYRKHTSLSNTPIIIKRLLFLLRFSSFFLLFLLLLKPELKKHKIIKESPRIVFLQDNSSSIILNSDSTYFKTNYLNFLDSLFQSINTSIDIFSFNSSIVKGFSNFQGQATNIGSVLEDISEIYGNVNVGAYILASDGLYNEGVNPMYLKSHLNAPLYTIMLGDTTQRKDALISSIKNNKISYLGNRTPVEVIVKSTQMKGKSLVLEVFNDLLDPLNDSPIYSEKFNILSSNSINKIKFLISPETPGLQNYSVVIKSNSIEDNMSNNKKPFFVDVIDDRKKILILFSAPHPDVSAIKESLETHDQYQVYTKWISGFDKQNLNFLTQDNYDLVILHQLPSKGKLDDINIDTYNTPVWYIVGQNSDLDSFNKSQSSIKFNNINSVFDFSHIALNRNFSSFLISDSLSDFLSLSTPFFVPSSDVSFFSFSDVLLSKKIGSINTEKPVLFLLDGEYNSAYLIGEGLWRWRLNDTYLNDNNLLFNQFISKIIQYLVSDQNKSRFLVNYNPVQSSGDRVIFEAELYNKNFELTTEYDVSLSILDSIGNQFNYQLTSFEKKYYLDVSLLKGKYSFEANAKIGEENFTEKGAIIISDFSVEKRNLVANHPLLIDLALSHGGYGTNKDSLEYLINNIISSSEFTPQTYVNYNYESLINFKSLLFLIILCLFLEWFLRRRYISY